MQSPELYSDTEKTFSFTQKHDKLKHDLEKTLEDWDKLNDELKEKKDTSI